MAISILLSDIRFASQKTDIRWANQAFLSPRFSSNEVLKPQGVGQQNLSFGYTSYGYLSKHSEVLCGFV